MYLHFLHAERLLWLAVVLPLVFGLVMIGFRMIRVTREAYGEARLVEKFTRSFSSRRRLVHALCWTAIAACLVITCAQPVAPEAPDRVKAGSMQIVIVSDVSWSMQAEDYRGKMPGSRPGSTPAEGASGSRLQFATYLMGQVMDAAPGNEVGIVTYMGEGYPLWELDSDYGSVRFMVDNFVTPGNAPGGGSDISSGLAKALDMFKRDADPSKQHVIVLFSDGGFDGDKAALAKVLAQLQSENIRLVVVGVGGSDPQAIPQYRDDGTFVQYRKDDKGTALTTTVDTNSLQQIAAAGGGEFHYVAPGQTSLDVNWPSALGGSRIEKQEKPVFAWFIGTAFVLLLGLSLSGLSRKRDVL